MAKKTPVNFIYLIGMVLVSVGFLLPVFQFKLFGTRSVTGFDLVGDGDTLLKIYTLLIFIGGIAGVVFSLVALPKAGLLRLVALLVSVVAFILVFVSIANSDGASILKGLNLGKKAVESVFKSLYIGGYMIIAGWFVAAAGLITAK